MVRIRVEQKRRKEFQNGRRSVANSSPKFDKKPFIDSNSESIQNRATPMQLAVLRFIENFTVEAGSAPSLREVAEHFGKALGTIQDHVKGLKQKGLIAELNTQQRSARGLVITNRAQSISVPILGYVPAGGPSDAIESADGFLSFSLPNGHRISSNGDRFFALRVRGDSMKDAGIFDGDLAIVKHQKHANHGDIVVAMIDGQATVKTFDKKQMKLMPQNPRYDPIVLDPNRDNAILGKVVSVQRYYGVL